HDSICSALFNNNKTPASVNKYFDELKRKLKTNPSLNKDYEYDQIVSFGELISSTIVYEYLNEQDYIINFLDIRTVLRTDNIYKEANIDWETSKNLVSVFVNKNKLPIITQGFIGSTHERINTTLGREGSDFTAAALAYMLDAQEVVIWKDVPGIMNADPAWCKFAEKIDVLSYQEAIELSFFGAKVIHPKTIKPLQNKNIPLRVKSFVAPNEEGTIIKKIDYKLKLIPVYILKENQILLSISPRDFSFIVEENISKIFSQFAKHRIKVNMIQNSAISFTASIDNSNKIEDLIKELSKEYTVKYNNGLTLITIRHYNDEAIDKMIAEKTLLLEQRSRLTIRMVTE
ncbi:MAG TPA: aspartate kinase, partial [Bacteroidales bacterium]|nr:aspartate kinase [Bacteroidales bacterium]